MGIKKWAKERTETRKYRVKKRKELKKAYDVAYYKAKKTAIEAEARKAAKVAARPLGEKLAGVGRALGEGFAPMPAGKGPRRAKAPVSFINPDLLGMPTKKPRKKPKKTSYGY